MQRVVSAYLAGQVLDLSEIVLSVAVAYPRELVSESLTVAVDGEPIEPIEIAAPHGGRLHVAEGVPAGRLTISYTATVTGQPEIEPIAMIDRLTYLRPSRYCESDKLAALAYAQFEGLRGRDLLSAVSSWVGINVGYVTGSSRPIDGAVATLLAREGVCRDFAHLVIALLRACHTPARFVAVYAPGLNPMDFHAVAEAYVDGAWHVVDPTLLAPRSTLVRIATGRDASDAAFLSSNGLVKLLEIGVSAVVNPALPRDDITQLVALR